MPQDDNGGRQVNEPLKVFRVIFITHDPAAKVEQPGEQLLAVPFLRGHFPFTIAENDRRLVARHDVLELRK